MTEPWTPPALPAERTYWVAPGLLGGVYPGHANPGEAKARVGELMAGGVTLFIDLTDERDGLEPYAHHLGALEAGVVASRLALPVRDLTPPSRHTILQALEAIDAEVDSGGTVYVHCWGGKGRTGTVLGCYLARTLGGPEALRELNTRRDAQVTHPRDVGVTIPETGEQRAVVRRWRA